MQAFNVFLQHLLPQHGLSRLVLWLTRVRFAPFKNAFTALFIRGFRPDLSDAENPDPYGYEHFNAFFTRALRAGARPLQGDAGTLVSPVDGTMSQCGAIDANLLLQAKGHYFSLEALLAGAAADWAPHFRDGSFATIYLAPYNYHRIHMPTDGRLCAAWYVPGRLFSVNATAARMVPGLFARNERVVLLFEGACGPFAVILVGALNVGSMATVWHGDVTPRRPRRVTELPIPAGQGLQRRRGEELGRFNMGSTVILLFGAAAISLADLPPGTTMRLGQRLGVIREQRARPA